MKALKIALIIFFLLVGSQGGGICGPLIDETQTGQAPPDREIPDRPMRDDANLKAIQTAFDDSDPRANIERQPFHPDMTYKIRLREYMGSEVVLPPGEKISAYSLFDKTNFTFTPLTKKNPQLTNVFEIHARYHGADTNLIVHGESGNIYSFYLRVDSVDSPHMPRLITYIEDPPTTERMEQMKAVKALDEEKAILAAEKEATEKKKALEKIDNDYLASLPAKVAPEDLNFAYEFKGGNEDLKPIRVFDDGFFTFFQFGEKNMNEVRKLPTIYRVVDGYDVLVNTRIDGGCLIAETINAKWTLRSGGEHFCVWKQDE